MPRGDGGKLTWVVGGTIAAPRDVQVRPQEQKITAIDVVRALFVDVEHLKRRPGCTQGHFERRRVDVGSLEAQ
jgi:hypothetical protein